MKLELVALSFLLFAFPLAFSDDFQQVVDRNGNPLIPGREYYIFPTLRGPADGGLNLGITGNSKCPVTVLQNYFALFESIPVKINMARISTTEIFTGGAVDIEFAKKPNCVESSKWVMFIDNEIQKAYVGIGGPQDHPGQQALNGTFSIRGTGLGYRLVFCVTWLPTCFDIGRDFNLPVQGMMRLVITDNDPWGYTVRFIDAASYSGVRSVV